jgi:hypothetical protein
MSEAVEQETRTEDKPPRRLLGQRGKAATNDTKLRVMGAGTKVPILDVAAFNSFIG